MINYNGKILYSDTLLANNRGLLYGDAVFETLKIVNNKVLFLEDHYFRLMSTMRMTRMEIPMDFTMEYLEEQVLLLATANNCVVSARARITVFRNQGGNYMPDTNSISFVIATVVLENHKYAIEKSNYEVELYKDFYTPKHLLSTLKTTNKMINVIGSIFAKENELDNCLLLNEDKNVIEALQGNLFMLIDNKLITPPISDGCLNGIMRKQIIAIVKKLDNIEFIEQSISPFELQKADELFITNVIKGIQPITKYRKKEYSSNFANKVLLQLNALV